MTRKILDVIGPFLAVYTLYDLNSRGEDTACWTGIALFFVWQLSVLEHRRVKDRKEIEDQIEELKARQV